MFGNFRENQKSFNDDEQTKLQTKSNTDPDLMNCDPNIEH